jgi:hypothetical protein
VKLRSRVAMLPHCVTVEWCRGRLSAIFPVHKSNRHQSGIPRFKVEATYWRLCPSNLTFLHSVRKTVPFEVLRDFGRRPEDTGLLSPSVELTLPSTRVLCCVSRSSDTYVTIHSQQFACHLSHFVIPLSNGLISRAISVLPTAGESFSAS